MYKYLHNSYNTPGSLVGVKKWWEYLQANGPDFGYCPKPAKTILLIKDSSLMQATQKILKDDGIKITDQGERLLGSVIGTDSFREQYIKNKVESWVKDLQSLSQSTHKMTLKQRTQHSPKVYPPDGPISKEQRPMRVNYLNHLKTPSEIN